MRRTKEIIMTRASILFIVTASLTASLTITGCKSKDGEGGAGGAAGKSAPSEPAKPAGPTKLPSLGLSIDVPGAVEVGKAILGEGHMLTGADIGAMQIELVKTPKTLDDEKADADMFSPKDLKAEALADGWMVTFNNTGGMGANYFVTVQREIGGNTYKCSTTQGDKDRAAAVLAACKTLRQ
jgi:hypothetical protein